MHVTKSNRSEFLQVVNPHIKKMERTPGCLELRLFIDSTDPDCFVTQSRWENEESLENYRNSDLFRSVWAKVKPFFSDRAEAFTLKPVDESL